PANSHSPMIGHSSIANCASMPEPQQPGVEAISGAGCIHRRRVGGQFEVSMSDDHSTDGQHKRVYGYQSDVSGASGSIITTSAPSPIQRINGLGSVVQMATMRTLN